MRCDYCYLRPNRRCASEATVFYAAYSGKCYNRCVDHQWFGGGRKYKSAEERDLELLRRQL